VTATCGTLPSTEDATTASSGATVQQVTRKNSEAWRSFFALKEKGEYANPPSYWGNEEDGRELRTYIRCNQYTIEWGNVAVSKSLSGKN